MRSFGLLFPNCPFGQFHFIKPSEYQPFYSTYSPKNFDLILSQKIFQCLIINPVTKHNLMEAYDLKPKIILYAVLIAVYLMAGCVLHSMTAIYENDQMIASSTNSYSLINIEQLSEERHFTASVEKMEGMDTIWDFNAEENMPLDVTYTLKLFPEK